MHGCDLLLTSSLAHLRPINPTSASTDLVHLLQNYFDTIGIRIMHSLQVTQFDHRGDLAAQYFRAAVAGSDSSPRLLASVLQSRCVGSPVIDNRSIGVHRLSALRQISPLLSLRKVAGSEIRQSDVPGLGIEMHEGSDLHCRSSFT